MNIDQQKLIKALEGSDREQLLNLLKAAANELDGNCMHALFGEFYNKHVVQWMSSDEIKVSLQDFQTRSLKGVFYDHSWEWNSKTYNIVTPLTQSWYDEMGFWLDVVSEKAITGEKRFAKEGFDLLFDLIEELQNEEIIVPHHDIGEENIYCQYDYRALREALNR